MQFKTYKLKYVRAAVPAISNCPTARGLRIIPAARFRAQQIRISSKSACPAVRPQLCPGGVYAQAAAVSHSASVETEPPTQTEKHFGASSI